MRHLFTLILALSLACVSHPAIASDVGGETLTTAQKQEIITTVGTVISANYYFTGTKPDIASKLAQRMSAGAFDAANTKASFAAAVSAALGEISGDLHFSFGVDPQWVDEFKMAKDPAHRDELRSAEKLREAATNYGFDEVRRLEGNIGYIRFNHFANPDLAYQTATGAMQFLENSDAIIFDLRYNGGGYLEMAQLLASYLFPVDHDRLLFDYDYVEDGKQTKRGQWVLPGLPSKRMTDVPVYILTSTTTFSAAEWFSFTLKKLGRATLVGERTAGGAHPVDRKPVGDDFFVQLPIGQIRDPVDGEDFERTGVAPDRDVAAYRALSVAHMMALDALAKSHPDTADDYAWIRPLIEARARTTPTAPTVLARAVGRYEGRDLVIEDGQLYHKWRGHFSVHLEPLSPTLFAVEGVDDFRYRLRLDGNRVTGLERVRSNGQVQFYPRIGKGK